MTKTETTVFMDTVYYLLHLVFSANWCLLMSCVALSCCGKKINKKNAVVMPPRLECPQVLLLDKRN